MGLDQYAYKRAIKNYISKEEKEEALVTITSWRKHNRLQGWMENLWESKGNEEEMNCKYLQLTMDDIESLEKDVENEELPETIGFFFGQDSYNYKMPDGKYEDYENDINFIEEAKEALKNNMEVFYCCWY